MQNKLSKGFTLIELLIVIAILAVMATLFINNSNAGTKKARDSRRSTDLKQYQTALEIYANKNNGFYPSRGTVPASTTLCTDLALTGCSSDPKNDPAYVYNYQSDGLGTGTAVAIKYVLWARLEAISPTTYIVYCSNGKGGNLTTGIPPTGGTCPLP